MMKIKLSAFVAIAVLSWGQVTLAEEANHDAAKAKESGKTESEPSANWKEEYKKLTDAFGKIPASLPVIAVPAVALPDNKEFNEFNLTGAVKNEIVVDKKDKNGEVQPTSIMTILAKYREKLKKCGKEDAVAKDLAALLDAYVIHLRDTFGDDPSTRTGKDNRIKISEKTVNTYTTQIIKLLDKKAESFKGDKATFEKSDEELKKSLRSLAGFLWGDEKGAFKREKTYSEAKMRDDKDMKKIVESVDKTITNVEHAAKETDNKTCALDDATSPGDDTDAGAGDTSADDDSDTAGPAGADGADAGDTTTTTTPPGGQDPTVTPPGQTPGGQTPVGQLPGGPTNPIAGQDLLGDPALAAQFQALQDAIQRAEDQAEFERQRNADLQNERDQDNQDNQGLIEALAGLQPDGARNNERSNTEGSPSTQFPSGGGGSQGGGEGQVPPPPEVPQPPPPQPFNPYAMMPQQQQQQLPLELFARKKADDDEPRRPVVVQDPNSSALLEQLKTQGMVLQQLLAQRMQPMVQGVQNVGNALSNFGTRMVRGLSTRRAGSTNTMMGSASGGAQGQLAVPGARTPIPSAIFGKR